MHPFEWCHPGYRVPYPTVQLSGVCRVRQRTRGLYVAVGRAQGYHQLRVALESRLKLAFQGPYAIKWTYNVMPFGPTNGPATFINCAHDICSVWQELARSKGVPIGNSCNTRIIVDNLSIGEVTWTYPCYTCAANYRCACISICCSAFPRHVFSLNNLSSWAWMLVLMEISPLCRSTF